MIPVEPGDMNKPGSASESVSPSSTVMDKEKDSVTSVFMPAPCGENFNLL
jgi:hypothetical protein